MNELNYREILSLFLTHKKKFIIVSLVAICLSVFFSSPTFIAPKFTSEMVIYPSNISPYSNESATEQLLQVAEANFIRDSIVKKYQLLKRYEIDPTDKTARFQVQKIYNSNVKIQKTSYESVSIEVSDIDPITAKDIASEINLLINYKVRSLHRIKYKEVFKITKDQLESKKNQIREIIDSIQYLSTKYDLVDYTMQSKEITKGYVESFNKNATIKNHTHTLFQNVSKYGRIFEDLHQQLFLARKDYNAILIGYENAKKDVEKEISYTNIIVSPEIPDKKSAPVRWLIVLITLFSSLFFLIAILVIKEKFIS